MSALGRIEDAFANLDTIRKGLQPNINHYDPASDFAAASDAFYAISRWLIELEAEQLEVALEDIRKNGT